MRSTENSLTDFDGCMLITVMNWQPASTKNILGIASGCFGPRSVKQKNGGSGIYSSKNNKKNPPKRVDSWLHILIRISLVIRIKNSQWLYINDIFEPLE